MDDHIMDYSAITDRIFVGSDLCKGNVCPIHNVEFKKLGVTVELNMSMEKKEFPPNEMDVYSWLPVKDGFPPNECQLEIGTSIINEAVTNGNKVYLHCKNGHGRSPTMLAAYFIRFLNKTTDEAIDMIKMKRPEIHLQEVQINALKAFENKHRK